MFLGRASTFRELISRLELAIKTLVTERGAAERAHQSELERLENSHLRETEALKKQIAYLEGLNERLLRNSGLEPIRTEEVKETVTTQTQSEPIPTTISGNIIARDKKKTAAFRAFMEEKAQEMLAMQNKEAS